MKIINLEAMVESEAVVWDGKENHLLHEPTIYEWAEYLKKVRSKMSLIELKIWAINSLVPTIDVDKLKITEFDMVSDVCFKVFQQGICELGKKTKPLEAILMER